MDSQITITLQGRFYIEGPDRNNLTPKSAKAQGLLALVASAPRMERSRRWLQDKLWSDRGAEQGAASLRQTLSEIRKAFGNHRLHFETDRTSVRLINAAIHADPQHQADEFLEGIDLRDPEFEDWLTAQRAQRTPVQIPNNTSQASTETPAAAPPPSRLRIELSASGSNNDTHVWFERLFMDRIAKTIQEVFSSDVVMMDTSPHFSDTRQTTLRVCAEYLAISEDTLGLRVYLQEARTGRRLWSEFCNVDKNNLVPANNPDLLQVSNFLIDAISEWILGASHATNLPDDPNQLCRLAIRKMLTMRADQFDQADDCLARAYDLEPRGIYLAWRAQLRTIQCAERHAGDRISMFESARSFTAQALEKDPYNSMVLATAANSRLFIDHDVAGSKILASQGVKLNSANPMVWWSLSACNLYTGDVDRCYSMADLGRRIAAFSPHGFWWDLQKAAAAFVGGRLEEARDLFEMSHSKCPDFRPPLRYLTVLYAHFDDYENAVKALNKLNTLEPDFSVDRLLKDREYPASLIWRETGTNLDNLTQLV